MDVFVDSYVRFLRRSRAAVVIQKNVRMWAAKSSYKRQRSAAVAVQSFLRAHVARKKFHQVTHEQPHHPEEGRGIQKGIVWDWVFRCCLSGRR